VGIGKWNGIFLVGVGKNEKGVGRKGKEVKKEGREWNRVEKRLELLM